MFFKIGCTIIGHISNLLVINLERKVINFIIVKSYNAIVIKLLLLIETINLYSNFALNLDKIKIT